MTIIHGDPKNQNFNFNNNNKCIMYDFQYCGKSYGTRDIAHFFVSTVNQ